MYNFHCSSERESNGTRQRERGREREGERERKRERKRERERQREREKEREREREGGGGGGEGGLTAISQVPGLHCKVCCPRPSALVEIDTGTGWFSVRPFSSSSSWYHPLSPWPRPTSDDTANDIHPIITFLESQRVNMDKGDFEGVNVTQKAVSVVTC